MEKRSEHIQTHNNISNYITHSKQIKQTIQKQWCVTKNKQATHICVCMFFFLNMCMQQQHINTNHQQSHKTKHTIHNHKHMYTHKQNMDTQ